jgi:nucleoside-diphosphate-sugar epimerase
MILVTGASGLLGLHLIKNLSLQQQSVRALYNSRIPQLLPDTRAEQIEWLQCDILDITQLESCFENITQVYHCAAMVSYDERLHDLMMEVNAEGTANVVNLCIGRQVQKLLFVSSIAAVGKEDSGTLIHEKTIWNTTEYSLSQYAVSKQKAEMEVWRGIAEGLNAVIVNPGVILGEGDDAKSSTNLFKIVYDEFPYYTAGATAWVDVQDVVTAMTLLMNSDINSERFILSAGNFSFKEIFDRMAAAMRKKAPSRFAPLWLTGIVWRLSYLKSILTGHTATITKETARHAHEINRYDNTKFLKQFPAFQYHDISSTIRRVAAALYP